jgi:hypothetical protein
MSYPVDPYERQRSILSDEEIDRAFAGTNFGPHANFRRVVNESIWKVSCGYSNGWTAEERLIQLGLASRRKDLSLHLLKRGRQYLRCCTMPIVPFTPSPQGEKP